MPSFDPKKRPDEPDRGNAGDQIKRIQQNAERYEAILVNNTPSELAVRIRGMLAEPGLQTVHQRMNVIGLLQFMRFLTPAKFAEVGKCLFVPGFLSGSQYEEIALIVHTALPAIKNPETATFLIELLNCTSIPFHQRRDIIGRITSTFNTEETIDSFMRAVLPTCVDGAVFMELTTTLIARPDGGISVLAPIWSRIDPERQQRVAYRCSVKPLSSDSDRETTCALIKQSAREIALQWLVRFERTPQGAEPYLRQLTQHPDRYVANSVLALIKEESAPPTLRAVYTLRSIAFGGSPSPRALDEAVQVLSDTNDHVLLRHVLGIGMVVQHENGQALIDRAISCFAGLGAAGAYVLDEIYRTTDGYGFGNRLVNIIDMVGKEGGVAYLRTRKDSPEMTGSYWIFNAAVRWLPDSYPFLMEFIRNASFTATDLLRAIHQVDKRSLSVPQAEEISRELLRFVRADNQAMAGYALGVITQFGAMAAGVGNDLRALKGNVSEMRWRQVQEVIKAVGRGSSWWRW